MATPGPGESPSLSLADCLDGLFKAHPYGFQAAGMAATRIPLNHVLGYICVICACSCSLADAHMPYGWSAIPNIAF